MATSRFGFNELVGGQANNQTAVNDNSWLLDLLVQVAVIDKDLTAPPGSPVAGDIYIVGASATGAWATYDGQLAYYKGSSWVFFDPFEGVSVFIADEDLFYIFDGTDWVSYPNYIIKSSSHDMASDADYTLVKSEYVANFVEITDTGVVLTAGRNIVLPTLTSTQWTVRNSTAQILTFKTSAGTGIAVASSKTAIIYGDGTNITRVTADA